MKPEIIYVAMLVLSFVAYSCTKTDSLPQRPTPITPDTILQTTPPVTVEKIISSEWDNIKTWKLQPYEGRNLFSGTITEPKLKQSFIDNGAVLIFFQSSLSENILAIPDNANTSQVNFVTYDNDYFTSVRQAGSMIVAVASLHGQDYSKTLSNSFKFRYFLIPKSRLKQGLDYTNYKAVCNYYKINL